MAQLVDIGVFLVGRQAILTLAMTSVSTKKCGKLGGEGLGRGDTDFRAGAGDESQFRFTDDGRLRHVADRPGFLLPEALGMAQRGQGVGGFAGLRDGDDQLARIRTELAVAVFAGDFDGAGNAAMASSQ